MPAPFLVYADFESILKPVDNDVDTAQGVEVVGEASSRVFQEHIPSHSSWENAAEKFERDLHQKAKQLFDEYIATPKPCCLCCLVLHNCDRLTTLLSVIYVQNRLEMIQC